MRSALREQRKPHLQLAGLAVGAAAVLIAHAEPPAARALDVPIVYASRVLEPAVAPEARTSAVDVARSGKLVLLTTANQERILVDGAIPGAGEDVPTDVTDPDVSHDAARVVFSGFSPGDGAWRIYELALDGNRLTKVTASDRIADLSRYGEAAARLASYDDLDPCYLPDGRICFVSTRFPGIAPDGRVRTTNLYVVRADGRDLRRITSERFAADTPAVDPSTGRIVYSRWWRTAQVKSDGGSVPEPIPPGSPGYGNVDPGPSRSQVSPSVLRGVPEAEFPGLNSWFLASINPDGTGLQMHTGVRLDREQTQAWRPSFEAGGSVLALFIPRTPLLGRPGMNGLRRYRPGPSPPAALGGPQSFSAGGAVPGLPPDGQPFPVDGFFGFLYASAEALDGGRVLVTGSPDGKRSGVYVQTAGTDPAAGANGGFAPPVLVRSKTGEDLLDAVPLVPRAVPPVIRDVASSLMSEDMPRSVAEAVAQGGTFKFLCENVHFNAPVDFAIASAPPVGKRLAIEFYMAPQRTAVESADPPILIASQEIGPDGKIEAELPAGVPLFEVLRRPDGTIGLGRDGQIFHVGGMNFGERGQQGRCVGCHAGHSMLEVPQDAAWTNLAPSAVVHEAGLLSAELERTNPFAPQGTVDRRTDAGSLPWASAKRSGPYRLELRWSVPIRAREVTVYAARSGDATGVQGREPVPPAAGDDGRQAQTIKGFTAVTYLAGEVRETVPVSALVSTAGTKVRLTESRALDMLALVFDASQIEGSFLDRSGPALAEVEVIATAAGAGGGVPAISFVRGDATCDSHVNLTDAITVLRSLFQGGGTLCCTAAADANDDQRVNLSDPISVLRYLFMGADPLPLPGFQDRCSRWQEGALLCDQESCF
ncbi:MAG: hypothetical protein HY721_23115 [Planctomycetes bacterium]|nr:hypothetical protein [Planctomycetota bacterium]